MTYDRKFRERVVSYIEDGGSKASASSIFKISPDSVQRWWKNRTDLEPKRTRNYGSSKLDEDKLIKLIESSPDLMLKEYASLLSVGIGCIHYALKRLGYSRKKNGTLQRESAICQVD